ncbi:MAG TPA: MOSC N-terminal beta barrel domain-containing protein [Micromonosporaceae bacterium]
MSLGRLASIHTYPVKGCRRVDQVAAPVEPWGLAGDRRWMLVDQDGIGITQREATALATLRPAPLAGGLVLRAAGRVDLEVAEPARGEQISVRVFRSKEPVSARAAGRAADQWVTALLDRPARLVWLDVPPTLPERRLLRTADDRVSFADAYPLLLTTAASLDALNGWLADAGEEAVPMTRFRPNLVVDGVPAWAEDGWLGRRVRIGSVTFRAAEACDRCVVTTTDQETGVRGKEPLRTLAVQRRFGQDLLFGVNLIPDGDGKVAIGDVVEPLP